MRALRKCVYFRETLHRIHMSEKSPMVRLAGEGTV